MLSICTDKKVYEKDAVTGLFRYKAHVISAQDYYPFGWEIPGRKYNSGHSYRFGFNTQEKSDIAEGHTTAEFWEYSSRTARRWNRDPRYLFSSSPYLVFENGPIFKYDHSGDTSYITSALNPETGQPYYSLEQMQEMAKVAQKIDEENGIVSLGYKAVEMSELSAAKLDPIIDVVMVLDGSMEGPYGETMNSTGMIFQGGNVIDGWLNPSPNKVNANRMEVGLGVLSMKQQYLTGGVALNHESNVHAYRVIINHLTGGSTENTGHTGQLHHGTDGGLGGEASSVGYRTYAEIEKYSSQDVEDINSRNSALIHFYNYNRGLSGVSGPVKLGDLIVVLPLHPMFKSSPSIPSMLSLFLLSSERDDKSE